MRIFFIWMLILLFIITASDRTVRAQAVGLVTITAQNAATVNLLGALWHEFSQAWPIAIPSPDGRRLLSYGSLFFGSLRLWDLESLTTVATIAVTDEMKTDTGLPLGLDNHVQAIFSPDSSTLVISGSRYSGFATIQIWDATSGTIQGGITHGNTTVHLAFSPDGSLLLTDNRQDDEIRLWDTTTWQPVADIQANIMVFSPDGALQLSGWNGEVLIRHRASDQWFSVLRASGERFAYRHDRADDQLMPYGLYVTPDGQMIIIQTFSQDSRESVVRFWDRRSESQRAIYRVPHWLGDDVLLSPDSRTLALIPGETYKIHLIDVASGEERVILGRSVCDMPYFSNYTFSPDNRIMTCTEDSIQIQNVMTGDIEVSVPLQPEALAFSPDGSVLATLNCEADDHGLQLWDAHSGEQLAALPGPCEGVIEFTPDGSTLIVGSGELLVLYGIPSHTRPAFGSVPGRVVPSAINVRAAPSVNAEIIGHINKDVSIGGRDDSGMFLFLTSHGGWVRANLVFVDRYEIPLESLPVVTQDGD